MLARLTVAVHHALVKIVIVETLAMDHSALVVALAAPNDRPL